MTQARFIICYNEHDQTWCYKLQAGRIVLLIGNAYASRQKCLSEIAAVRVNAQKWNRYRMQPGLCNNKFVLLLPTGWLLGTSVSHITRRKARRRMLAVQQLATFAPLKNDGQEIQKATTAINT